MGERGIRGHLLPFHPLSRRGGAVETPSAAAVFGVKTKFRAASAAVPGADGSQPRPVSQATALPIAVATGRDPPPAAPRGRGEDARQILPPSHHARGWPLLPPPLPFPILRRCGGRGPGRAGRGSCWAEPGRAALGRAARGAEMLQLFFFFFSAEEGGRWIELCHVVDKFPLASSPCTSPPASPPHARWPFFFFPLLFFLVNFFSPVSDIFACSASTPGCAGGGGEGFSWLSTFPNSAACPAEAPAPPRLAALPRPRRGVRPGADALVLPAEEPASCLGTTGMISGGKSGGGKTQPSSFNPDSVFCPSSVVDNLKCGYLFEKVVKRVIWEQWCRRDSRCR